MAQLISILSFNNLILTIILLLDSFSMPINKHKCCLEVLNIYSKHKCCTSSSSVKLGSLIHPSLPSNDQFAICCNLECILKRSNESNKKKTLCVDNNELLHAEKKHKRCYDDLLGAELPKYPYRIAMRDLATNKQRHERVKPLAMNILASVVDVNEFKLNGFEYMRENQNEIGTDAGYVLSMITKMISKWMRYDIKADYNSCIPPTSDQVKVEDEGEVLCNEISSKDRDEISQKVLMAANSTDYSSVISSLNNALSTNVFPSYYLATKHRPELENGIVNFLNEHVHLLSKKAENQRMVERSDCNTDFEGKKNKISSRYYSKIKGGFATNYSILLNKLRKCNVSFDSSSIVMFDSFDGANHLETVEGKIDLVSFNSTLVSADLLSKLKNYSASRSNAILTWMQVAAKEESCMLLSMLSNYYCDRTTFVREQKKLGNNIHCFDVHDGKMLCNLTQHSLWNRKNYPFLLCKCKRGQAVRNYSNHRCKMISDKDQLRYYERSRDTFESKFSGIRSKVNVNKHCQWADENNYGITHFGIHPNDLQNSAIGFDCLHSRLSSGRGILSFIRKYLEGYGYDLNEKFGVILRKTIGEYYVECYETGKSLACMHGQQINDFISLMPQIISFFQQNLEESSVVNSIIQLLHYYPKIDSFIRISKVLNNNWYEEQLKEFKCNLACFQKAASETMHTTTTTGDNETFYAHVLFCYYPILADRLWKEHKLGLGIFNLQGMERRNKESKTAAKKYYNNKHNVCTQTINRMYDRFWFSE